MNAAQAQELLLNTNLNQSVCENNDRNNFNIVSQQARRKSWTLEEDIILKKAIKTYGTNWMKVASLLEHRNPSQCAQRWKRIKPEAPPKRDFWTPQEDELLKKYAQIYKKKWVQIAKHIPHRTSKQVRDRFVNKLNPDINQAPFTEEEDKLIAEAYVQFGSKWSQIVKFLKGRPENIVKNRFYTYIGKHYLNIENPYYVIQHQKNLSIPKEEHDSSLNSPSTKKGIRKLRIKRMRKFGKLNQDEGIKNNLQPKEEYESNCKFDKEQQQCKIEQDQIQSQEQKLNGRNRQDSVIIQKEEEINSNRPKAGFAYPQSIFYNLPIPMLIRTDSEFKIAYVYQIYNDPQFAPQFMQEHQHIMSQNLKEAPSVYFSQEQQTQLRDE